MKRLAACILAISTAAAAAAAERKELIEKSFPASPGKRVLIDAGPLDLTVRAAAITQIRVVVDLGAGAFKEAQAAAWVEAHRPAIEDTADALSIVAPDPHGHPLLKGVVIARARIEVVLPQDVDVDLSTSSGTLRLQGELREARPLRLRAGSGDIEFAGWAPRVEVRTTSGDVTINASRAIDHLMARSASGDVRLTGGAATARCDNSTGEISLAGLVGPAGIATTSGDVDLQFDALRTGDEVRVTTSSGKVRIGLPPGAEPGGEIASARGEIRSAWGGQNEPESGRFLLPGAMPKLYVTTTSGRIELY